MSSWVCARDAEVELVVWAVSEFPRTLLESVLRAMEGAVITGETTSFNSITFTTFDRARYVTMLIY